MSVAVAREPVGVSGFFTVERLLYAGAVVLAVGLRFYGLAAAPLNPLEAANAWPAWLTATGLTAPNTPVPDSALLHSVHLLLFWVAGGNDVLARLLPAAVGSALAWLPWFWRAHMGRRMALTVAYLIAVDPWLVTFSRLASGAILSLALALLILTCLGQMTLSTSLPGVRWRWGVTGSITAGLLLVSGAQSWSMWPIIFAFAWLFVRPKMGNAGLTALFADEVGSPEAATQAGDPALVLPDHPLRTLFWYFAAAALLGATAWLAQLQALGMVSASLTAWMNQIAGQMDDIYSFSWLLMRLVADEPFILVFGVAGLILLWRRGSGSQPTVRRQAIFLFLWFAWGLFLSLFPGRGPYVLLLIGFPLLLAAAFTLTSLLRAFPQRMDRHESGFALLAIGVLLVTVVFWGSSLIADNGFDLVAVLVGLLILVTAALLAVVYAVWVGWRETLWLVAIFGAVLLLFGTLRSTWQLNHDHTIDRQDGFFAQVTAPGARILAADMATLSAQRTGDPGEIPVQVELSVHPDPVLGWYLRDMRRLSWVLSAQARSGAIVAPLVVARDSAAEPAGLVGDYVGSDYALRTSWLPTQLSAAPIPDPVVPEDVNLRQRLEARLNGPWSARVQPLMRWLIYGEAATSPESDTILLWVERR